MSRKYQIDPKVHVWELNDDGGINIFALSDDIHNGPRCANCGYDFCHHCADTIEPCPAAKEARTPQDVEEFIALKSCAFFDENYNLVDDLLHADDIRTWMTGHVRVPVELIENTLAAVREELNKAHNEAYPVCCGQAGHQCCGSPEPEWPEHAKATMDVLGPIEKELSSMLNASKERI